MKTHNKSIKSARVAPKGRAVIPMRERWVFENKAVLMKINRGLKDAAEGNTQSMGSFSKYKDV